MFLNMWQIKRLAGGLVKKWREAAAKESNKWPHFFGFVAAAEAGSTGSREEYFFLWKMLSRAQSLRDVLVLGFTTCRRFYVECC